MIKFRPMRAATLGEGDLPALRWPKLVSVKYDGVRAVVINGELRSRKLKLIPNAALQRAFGRASLEWCEFELVSGPPGAKNCISRTMSQVMSRSGGARGVTAYLYDCAAPQHRARPYHARLELLRPGPGARVVKQRTARSLPELLALEARAVAAGYEGVVVRGPAAPYKCGSATLREQYLLKLKRFADAEAVVLAVHEELENRNEQTRDERGYARRSTHKANKAGKGQVGGFRARDLKTKVEFDVAPGKLTGHDRISLWAVRGALVGRVFTYRYQEAGVKSKPRFPRFCNWRDRRDM